MQTVPFLCRILYFCASFLFLCKALILECDHEKLSSQNLALGRDLAEQVKLFFPTNPVELIESEAESDLLEEFGEICRNGRQFKRVIIIGHSDVNGLQLCADRFITWDGLAEWIKPFDPQQVILLACEAGRWLPCAALFNGIPTLKEIFGSPIFANKNQRLVVLGKVLHILGAQKEDKNLNKLMQFGNFLLTKGLMFSRTRSEYKNSGDEEGEFWNQIIEPFLNDFIQRL